jgi:hypothetical protein
VELQMKDKKRWVEFNGLSGTPTFWDRLAGDGTKGNPYVFRTPGKVKQVVQKVHKAGYEAYQKEGKLKASLLWH